VDIELSGWRNGGHDDSRRLVVYYDEEKNLVSGKSSLGLKVFALSCSG